MAGKFLGEDGASSAFLRHYDEAPILLTSQSQVSAKGAHGENKMDGASLEELIVNEAVTFAGGVPTIWTMYLAYLQETGQTTASLERFVIGG